MSFGFGVGDFLAVIKLVKNVRAGFADAPKQFEDISTEVRSLSIVLHDIEVFISSDKVSEAQSQELDTILVGCNQTLEDTKKTIAKYCDLGTKGKSIGETARRSWKRLTLEPNDIRELRSRISSNTMLLNSLVGSVTRDNVAVTRDDVATLVRGQYQQQHQEVLDWLTPIDYAAQQSDYFSRRQAGTGQWLLDSTEYRQWIASTNQSLFCPGIPGAGKTILTSIVVDDLLERFSADGSIAICYIYCNFRRTEEQTIDDLLASLLKQLAQGQSQFPQSLMDLYKRHKERHTRPSTEEICKMLRSVSSSYSRVFLAVDALDEVFYDCRYRFISELLDLHAQQGANLLVTSRFIPEITERFSGSINKEIRATVEDVRRYLEGCIITTLPRFVSTNHNLQDEIKESVVKASNGMFLLAQLHLDSLRGRRSPKALRAALTEFATGSDAYDSAYNDAMDRISSQLRVQKELAFQALSWIVNAKRPLKTIELQHALGVEIDEPEFDEENRPDLHDVVSCCEGLITIDEQTRIVRLVHYTTQEYFERTKNTWFPDSQTYITKICVTYLSLDVFKAGICESNEELKDRLSKYPLYRYASHYWGIHATLATGYQWNGTFLEVQSQVDAAAQGLFEEPDSFWLKDRRLVPERITGLHLAAFFGDENAAVFSLQSHDVDVGDFFSRTPLSYASKKGNETVVRLLLEQKATVDSKDFISRTPLSYAAMHGHTTVVQLLLEKKATVNWKDTYLMTPLLHAASRGHEGIVQLLLKEKATVDSREMSTRRTPLLWATAHGHEAVVRLLLGKKAAVDSKDKFGQTPLSYAALNGNEAIVRLLLDSDAKVDVKDQKGRTPLWYAIENEHEAVVRLLRDFMAEAEA